jgi:hypothetical protein
MPKEHMSEPGSEIIGHKIEAHFNQIEATEVGPYIKPVVPITGELIREGAKQKARQDAEKTTPEA